MAAAGMAAALTVTIPAQPAPDRLVAARENAYRANNIGVTVVPPRGLPFGAAGSARQRGHGSRRLSPGAGGGRGVVILIGLARKAVQGA
jgi:hypothetical protein